MFNSERLSTVVIIAHAKLIADGHAAPSVISNAVVQRSSDTHKTLSMDVKALPTMESVKLSARNVETACERAHAESGMKWFQVRWRLETYEEVSDSVTVKRLGNWQLCLMRSVQGIEDC